MGFTHLHVHTEYSLLDGSNKIKEYVARVKELGMDSAAITDHGVMYGCIDFYRAAKEAGINPILGCEVYVAPGSRFDKEVQHGEDRYYHLVLLAENNQGYSNLMKIVSAGFVEGYYYKPRVDLEVLEKYHEGIIALSACLAGEIPRFLTRGLYEEGKRAALRYREIFGKNNFFLELQNHGIREQEIVNQQLVRMSSETGIELVCTNDVHYTYAEDAGSHDILLCIQTGKKVQDEDRMRYEGGQYYVKSEKEMAALFPYAPQALENTKKIGDRCHVEIEYVRDLHFSPDDVEYLRGLNLFDDDFLEYLRGFHFTGDIYAIPEGTVVFPREPLLKVVAPVMEAQLVETAILNIINHQSLIATKASRVVYAAKGDGIMEFGLRRAQGPDAGIYGARAAVIGGCVGTSNVLTGKMFDVPVKGTHAHSWIMSFPDEYTAFKTYANLYPNACLLLVDTYDVLDSGVPNAIRVFKEMKEKDPNFHGYGIRIDSGDLAYLSKKAYEMLKAAGFGDAIISASSDLDEYLIGRVFKVALHHG